MPDSKQTKAELLNELNKCRARIEKLEQNQVHQKVDDHLNQKIHFFESFINELTEPVLVIDTDFKVQYANKAAYEISSSSPGTTDELPCHKLLFNLDTPCHHTGRTCLLKQVIEEGKQVTIDHPVEQDNGEKKVFEILGSPIWHANGTLLGIVSTIRDVTQQRNDQQMLEKGHDFLELRVQERTSELIDLNKALRQEIDERQQTEKRLRWALEQAELLYQVSPCAIFTVNTERDVTSWNNKIEEISGYSYEENLGKKCDIFCNEPCALFSEETEKPILNKECAMRTKDGRQLIISKSADLLRDPKGNIIGGIESFEDVTKRKQMDSMLRSERDKFQGIIAATRQGVHILNSNYEIEFQNETLKKIFGDKIGQKCYEVYKQRKEPCEICRMHSVINSNQLEHADDIIFKDRHYSQSYAPFKDIDGETKCLVLLRDITVERENQAKTMRTAQLASIGELAAGVAHEINNPINGIINYAQILLDDNKEDNPKNALLGRLISEGERVAEIVSKLLAFARQREEDEDYFEEIEISTVLDDAFSLFKHQFLKAGIITHISVPPDLPPLRVHPHQLQQVFVNLFSNANYALNERFDGVDPDKILEVTAEKVTHNDQDFIKIAFTDHGIGIPQEIIELIFNPFYSTKTPGEGTGLGLSISQGIIQSFHGHMSVKSKPGKYTRMTVELPVDRPPQERL